jgi:hypothetical protein
MGSLSDDAPYAVVDGTGLRLHWFTVPDIRRMREEARYLRVNPRTFAARIVERHLVEPSAVASVEEWTDQEILSAIRALMGPNALIKPTVRAPITLLTFLRAIRSGDDQVELLRIRLEADAKRHAIAPDEHGLPIKGFSRADLRGVLPPTKRAKSPRPSLTAEQRERLREVDKWQASQEDAVRYRLRGDEEADFEARAREYAGSDKALARESAESRMRYTAALQWIADEMTAAARAQAAATAAQVQATEAQRAATRQQALATSLQEVAAASQDRSASIHESAAEAQQRATAEQKKATTLQRSATDVLSKATESSIETTSVLHAFVEQQEFISRQSDEIARQGLTWSKRQVVLGVFIGVVTIALAGAALVFGAMGPLRDWPTPASAPASAVPTRHAGIDPDHSTESGPWRFPDKGSVNGPSPTQASRTVSGGLAYG